MIEHEVLIEHSELCRCASRVGYGSLRLNVLYRYLVRADAHYLLCSVYVVAFDISVESLDGLLRSSIRHVPPLKINGRFTCVIASNIPNA